MLDQAVAALTALDSAGSSAFITCESGPGTKPQVVAKFSHIQDAQEYHRALVQCGMVARLIELGCGKAVAELIAAAKDIRDNPGTDERWFLCNRVAEARQASRCVGGTRFIPITAKFSECEDKNLYASQNVLPLLKVESPLIRLT
jgi:hypothetical protein